MKAARRKQGSVEQWALAIVFLLLLFWEKVAPMAKSFVCECTCTGENKDLDNTIDIPASAPDAGIKTIEVSKEAYERAEDQNVLDVNPAEFFQSFNSENDVLKITQHGIST